MNNGLDEKNLRLEKVYGQRIFEKAVEQIRDLIQTGLLVPGQKLPTEQELSRQLNVSRSSVREALRVLEAEGLIDVRRGAGSFIASEPVQKQPGQDATQWLEQREEALEQVLEVRESIESLAAGLAATRATQTALSELRSITQAQSEQIKNLQASGEIDYALLSQLDAAFHLAVSASSGNDLAHEIITRLVPAFNESNKAVLYISRRMASMEKEHLAILSALERRDAAAASRAMRDHIASVRKVVTLYK